MEETLRALYRLQQIDLQLDELDEGSGDLPSEVEELKGQADKLATSIANEEKKLADLQQSRSSSGDSIQGLRERIKSLNERLRTVRNNKEYEATTSEIESAEAELNAKEGGFSSFDAEEMQLKRVIEELQGRRDEATRELDEKNGTLSMLNETHADEVTQLRDAKTALTHEIDTDLIKRYEHIRTAHLDAVVKIRKGACSGCYRAITPQTIVEMRRGEQMFYCEHCGRIIIDEEIVASVSAM